MIDSLVLLTDFKNNSFPNTELFKKLIKNIFKTLKNIDAIFINNLFRLKISRIISSLDILEDILIDIYTKKRA